MNNSVYEIKDGDLFEATKDDDAFDKPEYLKGDKFEVVERDFSCDEVRITLRHLGRKDWTTSEPCDEQFRNTFKPVKK